MRLDILVCGLDEEEDFFGNDENNDDQEVIVLIESWIFKDVDYNFVEDVEFSDFDGGKYCKLSIICVL